MSAPHQSATPIVSLPPHELQQLLENAAERGARRALESVGLHDEDAAGDIRDVRSILESYRDVKRSMLATLGKALMVVILAAAAFKGGMLSGGGGGN